MAGICRTRPKLPFALSGLAIGLALAAAASAAPVPKIQVAACSKPDGQGAAHPSTCITWTDSRGTSQRTAALANNWVSMLEYDYVLSDGVTSRTVGPTTWNGDHGGKGFGYPVTHRANVDAPGQSDDVLLGMPHEPSYLDYAPADLAAGVLFQGDHQVIFQYKFTHDFFTPNAGATPNTLLHVPVTIQWTFSDGQDNPVYSITYDLSQVPDNTFHYDSRAPYGELDFSATSTTANMAGVEWGDRYKFTTTSSPVTFNSTWDWTAPNSVPYVGLWTDAPADATMGLVQTQSLDNHDAGAWSPGWHDVATDCWNQTSGTSAPGCRDAGFTMPWIGDWSYQTIEWNTGVQFTAPTPKPVMTWGSSYGFLGQDNYPTHDSGLAVVNASGWPRQSYSVAVVFGERSQLPVAAEAARTMALEGTALTTAVGSVATGGLAGNAPLTTPDLDMTYVPPGYDPVRGSLTFEANAAHQLTADITPPAQLTQPLIVVRDMAALPSKVTLDGATLVADTDYYASFDNATNEVLITLAAPLAAAAHTLEINPAAATFPTITTNTLPGGTEGTAYSATLASDDPAATWAEVGALPLGLTLDPATGVISGTPTETGTFPITVTATNGFGNSVPVNLNIVVAAAILGGGTQPIPALNAPMLMLLAAFTLVFGGVAARVAGFGNRKKH